MPRFGPKSFFQELRRRKVFAVVALYAAAAWVVIEVGGEAIDAGLITALTSRDLFMLAIIGFPLTLVAGWFYDITRHGIVRTAPAGAVDGFEGALRVQDYGLLALLIAAWVSVYLAMPRPPPVEASLAEKSALPRQVTENSIAILPFESRGDDPENANLAFGIHDDLMVHLGRVKDMTLIARSSVSKIEPGTADEAVAAKLGAAYVMRGTVERVLDRVRVNVTLVEAARDRQAWSNQFDREFSLANLFDIRTEIATSVTDELRAVLSPEEATRAIGAIPTANLEAYQLYMRARQLFARRGKENVEQALALYQKAVELDPEFALAWVGVADASWNLAMGLHLEHDNAMRDMREAVDRALALDDQLGEAYATLALVSRREGQPQKAAEACRKSLELSPNYALGHLWCLDVWRGRADGPENHLAALYRIAQMDPLSTLIQLNIAITLANMGQADKAREQYEHVLQVAPEFFQGYRWYGLEEIGAGNLARGIALLRRADELNPGYQHTLVPLFAAYLGINEFDHAAGLVGDFLKLPAAKTAAGAELFSTLLNSELSLARGDWAGSIAWLEKASPETQAHPWVKARHAWALLISGDMEKAREAWFKGLPDFVDPNDTAQLVESHIGCVTAGLLMATGDDEQGRELLARTTRYFEETLPKNDPYHAKSWVCYLVGGRLEKALDEYEKWVGRGQIGAWWRDRQLPWWDPVRNTPRFRALDERIDGLIAEQRELLRQMDET